MNTQIMSDPAAVAQLILKHRHEMIAFLQGLVPDPHAVEDVFLESRRADLLTVLEDGKRHHAAPRSTDTEQAALAFLRAGYPQSQALIRRAPRARRASRRFIRPRCEENIGARCGAGWKRIELAASLGRSRS